MIHIPFARLQDILQAGLVKKKKKPKKSTSYLFLLLRLVSFCLFFVLPLLVFIIYHLVFLKKIYPFVQIANREISGKTEPEAMAILNSLIEQKSNQPIILIFEEKNYQLNLEEIVVDYQIERTVKKAFSLGREKSFSEGLKAKVSLWQVPAKFPLDYQLAEELLESFLATISAQINSPAIPATIEVINKKVVVEPGKPGRKVDIQILKKNLNQRVGFLNNEPILISVVPQLPPVTEKQAEKTKKRAEKLIDKNLTVEAPEFTNTLSNKELISFLSFTDSLDKEKIASWTAQLASSIDRPPQNALFRFENGRVLEFNPAKAGLILDQEKTNELIINAITRLEQFDKKVSLIQLPVTSTPPAIKTEEVNNLGIKELIGKGESWFYGSIASRIHNVKLAADKFNGLLISPGETFSFNQAVGEIDQAHGYQQAYIIKEGRTVLGDGGGVCQVSTTFFRAALKTGLPIIERRAHAYRVSYYEQSSQVGQDATVFSPTVDLKIKNDTPAHILIQTRVNMPNRKLTFEFYGSSDGRTVAISKTRIWDQVPPPPPLYQDDPSLPAGIVKQIDWAAWGAKTAFDWRVTRGEQVLQEKTFYSSYRPWQAVFLKGTG